MSPQYNMNVNASSFRIYTAKNVEKMLSFSPKIDDFFSNENSLLKFAEFQQIYVKDSHWEILEKDKIFSGFLVE